MKASASAPVPCRPTMEIRLLLSVIVGLVPPIGLVAQEYHVDRDKPNQVTFFSDAPFEDFEGVTDLIDGYILWQGGAPDAAGDHAGSELYFEVELDGLDTGIRLRNRHMRENYLETDEYPLAKYSATIQTVGANGTGGFLISAHGTFSLHGFDREMDLGCEVTPNAASYRASCTFDVLLTDFDIKIPSLMFMKISDTISIEVVFFLVLAEPRL